LNPFSLIANEFSLATIPILVCILGVSAIMSGLSGFGFSAIGALCLWLLPPKLGVPLLMTLSSANQLMSLGQLKAELRPLREWWPGGPAPYLAGGFIGVPVGLAILHSLPTSTLMAIFGGFLIIYAGYSMLKPESLHVSARSSWAASSLVGMAGGVIGGFTAFPGAAVVVWSGLRRLPKSESRSIVHGRCGVQAHHRRVTHCYLTVHRQRSRLAAHVVTHGYGHVTQCLPISHEPDVWEHDRRLAQCDTGGHPDQHWEYHLEHCVHCCLR